MPSNIHLLRERKGPVATTRCGITQPWVEVAVTIWAVDVTCVICLDLMANKSLPRDGSADRADA